MNLKTVHSNNFKASNIKSQSPETSTKILLKKNIDF